MGPIALVPILVEVAVSIGTSLLLSAIMPKPKSPSQTPNPLPFAQRSNEERVWCYGTGATQGTVKYWECLGQNNNELWQVIAVHDTPCEAFLDFIINNRSISFSSGAAIATPNGAGTVSSSGTAVTGSGTAFLTKFRVGDKIVSGTQNQIITAIASDTSLTTQLAFSPALSGSAYSGGQNPYFKGGAPFMWRYDKLGSLTQTAESNLVAASATGSGKWTSACTGKGIAYFTWHLSYDQNVYQGGMPQPLLILKGRKLWDPRLDSGYGGSGSMHLNDETTWAWTNNAALCLLDYILGVNLNGTRVGGLGIPVANVDLPSFIAAANICDQSVSLAAGGTRARYTCDGFVSNQEDKSAVVGSLLLAMAGSLYVRGGIIGVIAAAAQSTSGSVVDADLADQITINPSISRQDKVNTLTSVYPEPTQNYAAVEAPPFTAGTYVSDDGIVLNRQIQHRFTTSLPAVARINKILLSNFREQLSIDAIYKPRAVAISAGQTFTFNSAAAGYSNVKMLCIRREVQPDGRVRIMARQETDSKYSWSTGEELTAPSFIVPNAFLVTDPSFISISNLLQMPNVRFCWDVGDARSFSGGGQTQYDLSSNGLDLYLGSGSSADGADPTFNGEAGDFLNTTYWSSGGSAYLTPVSGTNPAWMQTVHKVGGKFWMIALVNVFCSGAPGHPVQKITFISDEDAGATKGFRCWLQGGISDNLANFMLTIPGNSSAIIGAALSFPTGNSWHVLGISFDDNAKQCLVMQDGYVMTVALSNANTVSSTATDVFQVGGGTITPTTLGANTELVAMIGGDGAPSAGLLQTFYQELRAARPSFGLV